nr:hypothetical protein CFP56_04806 [Quercus suber]
MEQAVVEGLPNLHLTKEEEEEISITRRSKSELLEECALSLFGRFLSERHQNQRALKNTLRSTWKMGFDLQIVDVGNNILQFKFSSEYQLKWVEKNGPWNFDNNLLLLCRWEKGLSTTNITFTLPSWVQIWGLPFEHMLEEGNSKWGTEKSRSTNSGGQSDGNEDRVEENIQKTAKNSYALAEDGGEGSSSSNNNRRRENSKNMVMSDVVGLEENQSVRNQMDGTTLCGWNTVPRNCQGHMMR